MTFETNNSGGMNLKLKIKSNKLQKSDENVFDIFFYVDTFRLHFWKKKHLSRQQTTENFSKTCKT